MTSRRELLKWAGFGAGLLAVPRSFALAEDAKTSNGYFDVRSFGAKGDGTTIDTIAINAAIAAASKSGGGTVVFPAGTYATYSIRLKSFVSLYLHPGAVILAAEPNEGRGYDPPEPNRWDQFQDFGHSHWHNSLIWGENLENVSISGPGRIWGRGLVRSGIQSRTTAQNQAIRNIQVDPSTAPFGFPNPRDAVETGYGNKAISLKLCRNVIIRDVSILHGGHFAILATGVDNLTIDNLKIDTNRDGIDIDACRQVVISNCSVNSPFDDGICLKSSYALGEARPTQNVAISNCIVTGFDEGSLLDGSLRRELRNDVREFRGEPAPYKPVGRIKLGTESNGGFHNIAISNCVFDYSCGLALESVDGGALEDITISNITMRDIFDSPVFVRLGSRGRGPKDTTTAGALRRVDIANVNVTGADPTFGCIFSGIPRHYIEDVRLSNISVHFKGSRGEGQPVGEPPERETAYPEPEMFAQAMPSMGWFLRHCRKVDFSAIEITSAGADARPGFWLTDVQESEFSRIKMLATGSLKFVLNQARGFRATNSPGLKDTTIDSAQRFEIRN